jgi:hypothetical protein
MLPPDLEAAYRRTAYRVFADPPFVIRIDQPSPEADRLLGAADSWAFLSACNPGSIPLADAENAARTAALRARIGDAIPGEGRDADWAEASFWFAAPLAVALDLACEFGQLALVAGDRGGPARLVVVAAEC